MEVKTKRIVNLTRGNTVCERALIADRPVARMRGLLGRRSLAAGEGLLLRPASSVHTGFMRFPIDVLFLDGTLRVMKVTESLPPWRAAGARRGRSVIELAAGESTRRAVSVGDRLGVLEIGDRSIAPGAREAAGGTSEATRVLIVASDRRFRAVTAALLTRRGCAVTVSERVGDVARLVEQQAADVVLFDAGALQDSVARRVAQMEMMAPRIGIVIVAEGPHEAFSATRTLPKWGSFEELYGAIERARPGRAGRRSSRERL